MSNIIVHQNHSMISVKFVMTGLLLVILLAAIEQTIVAVILPVIASELGNVELVSWVVTAYLISSTIVIPLYGKLSDIYGRRAVMTTAIAIFLLASVGCALSQTMFQLIVFRLLQGIGGGGLISVAQATIADVVSPRDRGKYQAYISAVWLAASAAGPIAGGYLAKYLSWHWVFWINLPIGIIAMIVMRVSLRNLTVKLVSRSIDYLGVVLLSVGVGALLVSMTRIGQSGTFTAQSTIFTFICSVIFVALFIAHSFRMSQPIIPVQMYRNRTIAICSVVQFIAYFQMLSILVLVPLRLQSVGGLPSDLAALRVLPLTLAVPCGAFIAGRALSKTGRYKPSQMSGAMLVVIMALVLAFVGIQQIAIMAITMAILGVGIGLQFPTSMVATQNAVPHAEVGVATALASFSRMLGGAIGVAVLSSILIAFLRNRIGSASFVNMETMPDIFDLVRNNAGSFQNVLQASADAAFRDVFIIGAIISCLSPLLLLKLEEKGLRENAGVAA